MAKIGREARRNKRAEDKFERKAAVAKRRAVRRLLRQAEQPASVPA